MAAPCALVSCCSEKDPADLVREILGNQELPEGTREIEDIQSYPWKVETKYYTADIRVCCTHKRTIGDQSFADSVHAFVVHFDSNDADSFGRAKMWLPFLKEIMPEVQLLVCDRCDGSKGLSKEEAWAWCLDNGFELIELDPVVEEGSDDDDFAETLGIKRIIQALHAHTWPNLQMKDESTFRSPYMNKMMQEEATLSLENEKNAKLSCSVSSRQLCAESPTADVTRALSMSESVAAGATSSVNASAVAETEKNRIGDRCEPARLISVATLESKTAETEETLAALAIADAHDSGGEVSFEELFENLSELKNKAMYLPMDQRKVYAEKVAIGFWRAVCGDEDEIDGLSDSD